MNSLRYHIRFLRWHLGHTIPMIMQHASTYPELPRKSTFHRFLDNIFIYLRDGAPCDDYDSYGMDIKGRKLNEFVTREVWKKIQYRKLTGEGLKDATLAQKLTYDSIMPIHILQEKFCFYLFLEKHNIPTIPVLARTIDGSFYDYTSKDRPLSSYDRLFFKYSNALAGQGACLLIQKDGHFYNKDCPVDLNSFLNTKQNYIVQPVYENHKDIKVLNPTTLNTLRIVTCRTGTGEYELWDPGMIRIGRSNSVVDNFSKGGIGVAIDKDGKLKQYGFLHDEKFSYFRSEKHPDTQVRFEGFQIPFYKEAVALIKKTHKLFPLLQTIGWDVAITNDGPVLVEGNHDWGIEMPQVVQQNGYMTRLHEIYSDL